MPVPVGRGSLSATPADPDIRFLEPEEVEALLRGVPDDDLGRVERRVYLTAQ